MQRDGHHATGDIRAHPRLLELRSGHPGDLATVSVDVEGARVVEDEAESVRVPQQLDEKAGNDFGLARAMWRMSSQAHALIVRSVQLGASLSMVRSSGNSMSERSAPPNT